MFRVVKRAKLDVQLVQDTTSDDKDTTEVPGKLRATELWENMVSAGWIRFDESIAAYLEGIDT